MPACAESPSLLVSTPAAAAEAWSAPSNARVDLHLALIQDRADRVQRWLGAKGDPLAPVPGAPGGRPPLIVAAMAGSVDCVHLLLPVSDPNAVDDDGWSALTWAVDRRHEACTRALLPYSDIRAPLRSLAELCGRQVEAADTVLDLALRHVREAIANDLVFPVDAKSDEASEARLRHRILHLLVDASTPEAVDALFARAANRARRDNDTAWWMAADALALRASPAALEAVLAELQGSRAGAGPEAWGKGLLPRLRARLERMAMEPALRSRSDAGPEPHAPGTPMLWRGPRL
ncbi:ankyrin repeat domain-containing protein [Burkholderia pseudomallei]|uniref:ankyrin repeat domain-containing protein n=1 Tax=Burkholderia pseudomallei TaxID=28450 RepID=UPI000F075FAA|nr:ankyrin repeat domain-containing protein [Burkholderia pseudomallei]CAJ3068942.1 FOG domain-containing protein [Burkholderia pseudomallei]VCK73039.1 FOG domain-containing protein [Burkholderia pseudomallei]VCK79867.1 FOG domain-containing protein [Burkholderia pseudomallei]VCK80156.1 FOG domain-containing protein [Burkholderia pseudomallei]VCK80914.1 FOG domain-containing protein [Burkholderia pseudomallei]